MCESKLQSPSVHFSVRDSLLVGDRVERRRVSWGIGEESWDLPWMGSVPYVGFEVVWYGEVVDCVLRA